MDPVRASKKMSILFAAKAIGQQTRGGKKKKKKNRENSISVFVRKFDSTWTNELACPKFFGGSIGCKNSTWNWCQIENNASVLKWIGVYRILWLCFVFLFRCIFNDRLIISFCSLIYYKGIFENGFFMKMCLHRILI